MVVITGAVLLLIAVVAAFFLISGAAIFIPDIKIILIALGAGFLAYVAKDSVVYKSKDKVITGGLLFGSVAIMALVAMFLGVALPQFAITASPQSIEGILQGDFSEVTALDVVTIISLLGATFSIVLGVDQFFLKGKLLKKARRR